MAVQWGTEIVTDGLVAYLDAGNQNSYPGTGTSWTDISRINNTTSLINGPTFDSAYGGSIVFDGVNDYADLHNAFTGITPTNNFTMDIWFRPTTTHEIDVERTTLYDGTSGQRYLIYPQNYGSNSGAGVSAGTNGISVYEHGSAYMPALLVWNSTISSTLFTHAVITYTNKQPRLYVNGTLVRTGLTSPKTTVYAGRGLAIGDYGYFPGRIALYRVYSKSLSSDEVLQNYNATKSRFGL